MKTQMVRTPDGLGNPGDLGKGRTAGIYMLGNPGRGKQVAGGFGSEGAASRTDRGTRRDKRKCRFQVEKQQRECRGGGDPGVQYFLSEKKEDLWSPQLLTGEMQKNLGDAAGWEGGGGWSRNGIFRGVQSVGGEIWENTLPGLRTRSARVRKTKSRSGSARGASQLIFGMHVLVSETKKTGVEQPSN